MVIRRRRVVVASVVRTALCMVILGAGTAAAQDTGRPALRASPVAAPPLIDGILDDEAWRGPSAETGEWLSYNPLHGDPVAQKTHVWIGYDAKFLYFAFQADDPEPDRIKTSITRRDNIWSDDWVGISLDALGTGQSSYHLLVNPSGIQLDMLNSVSGDEDTSPDFIWDSAGRINDRGYAVEIRLPLQTIRFKGGDGTRMGILFWRRVSRLGVSAAWPPLEPGKWVFEKHASLVFPSLAPVRTRELIPSTTFSSRQERVAPAEWGGVTNRGDFGFGAKVGLTSTITLDATVNPDFSQVESDAFQVEVNQRFPVFFSEKRPFFMEGAGLFTLAGSRTDSSMIAAVHTRRIVDPSAGVKLTGSLGRLQFGTLTALDESAGRGLPPGARGAGDDRLFNVARAQYSLGASNYLGAIAADARFAGESNRVAGGDLSWRASVNQRVIGMVLYSRTATPGDPGARGGAAASAGWSYSTRRHGIQTFIEHYDRDFRMDTAFYNRVGMTSGWVYSDLNFYPDQKRYPWILRITPFLYTQYGRDRIAGGDESVTVPGLRLNFTRQGFFRVDKLMGFEPWQGRRFDVSRPRVMGEVQVFRWIRIEGRLEWGAATYYDAVDPFAGWMRSSSLDVSYQPTPRVTQSIGYRRLDFRRADTRERVYDLDILNTQTTFQFTKRFFLRGIAQYDSLKEEVLADFLASYELQPGTVVYVGYGSLHERRLGTPATPDAVALDRYLATSRGFFFKASYLYRF